jgi:2-aminoethylphosphonate-pyruvate transaminase
VHQRHFKFSEFYERLNDKGYVIYPGKVSNADCFRIGHIGRLTHHDMRDLLRAIQVTLSEMTIDLTLPAPLP